MDIFAKRSLSHVQLALDMTTKGNEFDDPTLELLNTLALVLALERRDGLISVKPGSINQGQLTLLAEFIGRIDEHVSCSQALLPVSTGPPNQFVMEMTASYIKEAIAQLSEQDRQPDARRNLAAPFGNVPNATILMLIIAKMHESGLFSYGELITSVLACVKFGAFPSTLTLFAVNITALETIIGKLYKSQPIEPIPVVVKPEPVESEPVHVAVNPAPVAFKPKPNEFAGPITVAEQRNADRARRSCQQPEEHDTDRSDERGSDRSDKRDSERSDKRDSERSGGRGNDRSSERGNDRSGRRGNDRSGRRDGGRDQDQQPNRRPRMSESFGNMFRTTTKVTSFKHHRPDGTKVYVQLNEDISNGQWFIGSGEFRKLAAIYPADFQSRGIKATSVKLQLTIKFFQNPVFYTVEMSPPTAEGVEKLLMALLNTIDTDIITNASSPVEIHVICNTDQETNQRAILVDELNQPYDCSWFVHYREMIKKKTVNGLCKCIGHENCENTDMNHLIEFHNDAAFALTKLNW